MMAALVRRLVALEQRTASGSRSIHFIKATDDSDRDRQMAELLASGKVGPLDGFLSITGCQPITH